ncbi:MAG TPA: winged helix-turn-helix domain-containing protein [Burkholderiaceae bacterium]
MFRSIGDMLDEQIRSPCMGRQNELALMLRLLQPDAAPVLFLHGVGGVGKSTLLEQFARKADLAGYAVIRLDCADLEPTAAGMCAALASRLGCAPTVAAIGVAVAARPLPTLIVFDHYEQCFLLDAWVRTTLIPALPSSVRVVLSGRDAAAVGWALDPCWHNLTRHLELGALSQADTVELLRLGGLPEHELARVARLTLGHPLTVGLAAASYRADPARGMQDGDYLRLLDTLAGQYVDGLADDEASEAVQRCSLLRSITVPALSALMPGADAPALFTRLARLRIVTHTADGLRMHALVREAVAARFLANDPAGHREARRLVWQFLNQEIAGAARNQIWRYTADLLYLTQSVAVRDAYFPRKAQPHSVEVAQPGDMGDIFAIARRHGGDELAAIVGAWRDLAPRCMHVSRSATQRVSGFFVLADAATVPAALAARDATVGDWLRHLRADPPADDGHTLFIRIKLCAQVGDNLSDANAAMCLDLKRAYVELRRSLARLYAAYADGSDYEPFIAEVGFCHLPECERTLDGILYRNALLDMGRSSFNGWLSSMIAAELAVPGVQPVQIDTRGREVIVDDVRVPLGPLEFRLLQYLHAHAGTAIKRDALLDEVWGRHYESSSNVVDVAVRALRRKLGVRAGAIETVARIGYRFRMPAAVGCGAH